MRLLLAIQAFFQVLFNAQTADGVRNVLEGQSAPSQDAPADHDAGKKVPAPPAPKSKPPAKQSEAITLLAALQREARFVDIVQESLDDYSDEQVGAAARDVLRDCHTALNRMFGIEAVVDAEEGADVEAPAGFDTGRYRITGNVTGDPPFQGQLVHHGWKAAKCELPQWSGSDESTLVIAPIEIEVG